VGQHLARLPKCIFLMLVTAYGLSGVGGMAFHAFSSRPSNGTVSDAVAAIMYGAVAIFAVIPFGAVANISFLVLARRVRLRTQRGLPTRPTHYAMLGAVLLMLLPNAALLVGIGSLFAGPPSREEGPGIALMAMALLVPMLGFLGYGLGFVVEKAVADLGMWTTAGIAGVLSVLAIVGVLAIGAHRTMDSSTVETYYRPSAATGKVLSLSPMRQEGLSESPTCPLRFIALTPAPNLIVTVDAFDLATLPADRSGLHRGEPGIGVEVRIRSTVQFQLAFRAFTLNDLTVGGRTYSYEPTHALDIQGFTQPPMIKATDNPPTATLFDLSQPLSATGPPYFIALFFRGTGTERFALHLPGVVMGTRTVEIPVIEFQRVTERIPQHMFSC
jgi:hypothetical protein